MADRMQLLALEMSPYSVKLRSYLRYKGISFEWITRGPQSEKLYQRHAKVQLIPLVIFPDGIFVSFPVLLQAEFLIKAHHPAGAISEPGTLAILGLGLAGLGLIRRKRAA